MFVSVKFGIKTARLMLWSFIIPQERGLFLQVVKQGIDKMSKPKIKHPEFYKLP